MRMLLTKMEIFFLLFTLLLSGCSIVAGEIEVAVDVDGAVDQKSLTEDRFTLTEPQEQHDDESGATPATLAQNRHENDFQSVLTALQHELEAVEQMVQLQERKLKVLEKVRKAWVDELEATPSGDENEEVAGRKSRVDFSDLIERKIDAALSSSSESAKMFDNFFVERAVILLHGPVADVKMVKLRANRPEELIAVAYVSGKIVFYASPATEMLTIDTKRHGIKSIALSSLDDQPSLIVSYDDPVIGLYSLNLIHTRKRSQVVDENLTPKTADHLVHTLAMGPEYSLNVGEKRDIQLPSTVSAIAIARAPRQLIATVAQSNGIIDFFALNGTSLRQLQTNSSITAMETRRNLVAFSNGTDVILSSKTRFQGSEFQVCPGTSAEISSITFDATQHDIIYAGTQRGDVLAYAVNVGSTRGCQLLSRSAVKDGERGHMPVLVATTKTYVIAAGPQDIAVFNLSRASHPRATLTTICTSNLIKPTNSANIPVMAFSEGSMGSHLSFITFDDDGHRKLSLFYSLLPTERDVSEFQWTAFLYSGIVIAAVVGTQLYVRFQKSTSVNPWDSIGKKHESPYGNYDALNDEVHRSASDLHGDDYDRYHSLSDDLRRKIAKAKKGANRYPIDEPDF